MLLEVSKRMELLSTRLAYEVLVLLFLLQRLRRTMSDSVVLYQFPLVWKRYSACLAAVLAYCVGHNIAKFWMYYRTGFEGETPLLRPMATEFVRGTFGRSIALLCGVMLACFNWVLVLLPIVQYGRAGRQNPFNIGISPI